MQLFKSINSDVVMTLYNLHLDLSHLWVLEQVNDISENKGNLFPESVLSLLIRKGYITNSLKLTTIGQTLYNTLSDPGYSITAQDIRKILKKPKEERNAQYNEWLSHYPATATFMDPNGKKWINTRILRQNSVENEIKYMSILKEGKYTQEELINALEFQKEMIIKDSMKSGENKMMYFQGTTPYLNSKTYEKQIETMKILNWKPNTIINKQQDSMLL